jgi:hypothetical protein
VFVPRPSQPSLMFASRVKPLSSTILLGKLLALPTNNRLSCIGLPGTNTLAYWTHSCVAKEIESFEMTISGLFILCLYSQVFQGEGISRSWFNITDRALKEDNNSFFKLHNYSCGVHKLITSVCYR